MTISEHSQVKARLRRRLRRARAEVPEALRRAAGKRVLRLALSAGLLSMGKRVAFYMPAKGELDILPTLNQALWQGVNCYLPVVPRRLEKRLWFSRLGDGPHWTHNRFDIPEYGKHLRKLRATCLDTIFLPLLGFDARGYRMGMGGGFYDVSLAHLRNRRFWRRPRLIGVGFEAQYCERIPNDPWDVPMDAVITEKSYRRFTGR